MIWPAISGDIGIGIETLRRWCVGAMPRPGREMVPVRVVADGAERTLSVVSASGHRIEGLTLDEAISVLRALG